MESTRSKLIEILSEQGEQYISGQLLSEKLQISRNSVWKHMKELEKDGYAIEGVPRKGYRIKDLPNKVSDNTVKWGLKTEWLGKSIIHKTSAPSTQLLIHDAARGGAAHGTVAIADEQTKGRGRMNRKWYSSKEKGMWISLLLRPNIPPHEASQLTLLTATVLADVIKEHTDLHPLIKWPNDILINNHKVAGILTEMQAEQDLIQYIVIGIGFNINHEKDDLSEDIERKATSLKIESGKSFSVNTFIQHFLEAFEAAFDDYIIHGFPEVKKKWESYGFKMGERIPIATPNEEKVAIFQGIADDGALLILDESGKETKLYSGEIKWFE